MTEPTHVERSQSETSPEPSLEEIVAELDAPYTGELPEEALRAAQRRSDEITPHLIALIEKATATVREGNLPEGDGHFFALFLLTEFGAKEALPAILESVTLPGEGPDELFSDAISAVLSRTLATLAVNVPEIVGEMVRDDALYYYTRWSAVATYSRWVQQGQWSREEAVARLHDLLVDAIDREDYDACTFLVCELLDFSPHEALHVIERAFELDLVHTGVVNKDDVRQSLSKDGERLERERLTRDSGLVEDTVEELRGWAAFGDGIAAVPSEALSWERLHEDVDAGSDLFDFDEFESDDLDTDEDQRLPAVGTIRNETPKIGRNEPCPCGSGKKYKKCCGRS